MTMSSGGGGWDHGAMSEAAALPPDRQALRVTTSSGSVTMSAERRDDIEIESGGQVERRPSPQQTPIDVRRSANVDVRCPLGTDIVIGTSSGSVRLSGLLGDIRVTSASGSISVEETTSADLRTASGDVTVEHCQGLCRITTSSGSVRVGQAGDADVRGVSGTVRVAALTARVRTVSGTIELAADGDASVATVSGRVTISLPPHIHPNVVARGLKRPKVNVDQGHDCDIAVRSVSGSVVVCSR